MRKHPRRVHPERGGGGFARRRPKISLVYMVQKSRGMLPVVSTRALERFASAITASMRPCRELPIMLDIRRSATGPESLWLRRQHQLANVVGKRDRTCNPPFNGGARGRFTLTDCKRLI